MPAKAAARKASSRGKGRQARGSQRKKGGVQKASKAKKAPAPKKKVSRKPSKRKVSKRAVPKKSAGKRAATKAAPTAKDAPAKAAPAAKRRRDSAGRPRAASAAAAAAAAADEESGDDEAGSDDGQHVAKAPMEPASVKGVSCGGTVVWARAHMQGNRGNMEDAFRVCTLQKPGQPQRVFLGVFDGHGDRGVVARAAAHRLAATVADQEPYLSGDVAGALHQAVCGTDEWLRSADLSPWANKRDPRSTTVTANGAGSCVACAVVEPQKGFVWTAHLGDSKVVVFDRDFNVVFATTDHKPGSDRERQRIHGAGGAVICLYGVSRVVKPGTRVALAVSRALGDHGLRPYVSGDCHLSAVAVPEGGGWVLVACDGVWDAPQTPEGAGAFLKERLHEAGHDAAGHEAVRAALHALCAQSAESWDNVTCVLARLPRGTSSPAPAGPAILRQQEQEEREKREAERAEKAEKEKERRAEEQKGEHEEE
eukprot:TRINITY_DN1659_c0_g1_i2.p2 TRINITY_DN1659_c0_g1~~TRINITY_DN1659_c0_g1_i2.p2  ORF type:complete len:505 (+),score=122.88 TRINITY_DN1659_c0_g1_i2:73-1515(+)